MRHGELRSYRGSRLVIEFFLSMTISRQECHHPTSSSSSSTSPTTIVLSDSESPEREDLSGIDSHPVLVSSSNVEATVLVQDRKLIIPSLSQARLPHQPWHLQLCQAKVWLDKNGETRAGWITIPQSCQVNVSKSKNGETRAIPKYRNGCKNSGKIWWMTEFLNTETDTPVLSHEPSLEPTPARSADLGKHSVYTHFPKDRNCEICQRTKITRAPCRRRIGRVVLRAENFGDLITADHKVLSDNCESRNNHRYAVVVQDLATQWIQSYPCKTKLHRKPREACKSSWSQIGNLMSFTLTIPWNLAKPVKIFPGIIVRRHHTDRKQVGLLREQYAEWKKVHLQYCCNQVGWKMVGRFHGMLYLCAKRFKISYLMGRPPHERRLGQPFSGPIIPFGSLVEYHPKTAKDQSRIHQFGEKVLPGLFLGCVLYAGWIWKGDIMFADIVEFEEMNASEIYSKRFNAK